MQLGFGLVLILVASSMLDSTMNLMIPLMVAAVGAGLVLGSKTLKEFKL